MIPTESIPEKDCVARARTTHPSPPKADSELGYGATQQRRASRGPALQEDLCDYYHSAKGQICWANVELALNEKGLSTLERAAA